MVVGRIARPRTRWDVELSPFDVLRDVGRLQYGPALAGTEYVSTFDAPLPRCASSSTASCFGRRRNRL